MDKTVCNIVTRYSELVRKGINSVLFRDKGRNWRNFGKKKLDSFRSTKTLLVLSPRWNLKQQQKPSMNTELFLEVRKRHKGGINGTGYDQCLYACIEIPHNLVNI